MESETLVTFLLPAMHRTATVEVLGSWDNFTTPYQMQYDKQKGHGSWFGCFSFSHIICDGDPTNCSMPRRGCLKMGGTYWYYYRRNGNLEFHNPAEAYTNSCPLLPGQTVNVLEVPIDSSQPLHLSAQTVNPQDRFRPPALTPKKVMGHLRSDSATQRSLKIRISEDEPPMRSTEPSRSLTSSQQKVKAEWLAGSVGRLQTAVVEYCMTMLVSHVVAKKQCTKACQLPRRAKSAPGICPRSRQALKPRTRTLKKSEGGEGASRRPQSRCGPRAQTSASDGLPKLACSRDFRNPFVRSLGEGLGSSRNDIREDAAHSTILLCHQNRPRTWHCEDDPPSRNLEVQNNRCETPDNPKRPSSVPSPSCCSSSFLHLMDVDDGANRSYPLRPKALTDNLLDEVSHSLQPSSTMGSSVSETHAFRSYTDTSIAYLGDPQLQPFQTFRGGRRDPVKHQLPPSDPFELPASFSIWPDSSRNDWTVRKQNQTQFDPKYSLWTPAATSPSDGLSDASARNSLVMNANVFSESSDSPSDSSLSSHPNCPESTPGNRSVKSSLRWSAVSDEKNESIALDHFASQETLKPASKKNPSHDQEPVDQAPCKLENGGDDFSNYRLPSPNDSIGDLSSLGEDIAARFGL